MIPSISPLFSTLTESLILEITTSFKKEVLIHQLITLTMEASPHPPSAPQKPHQVVFGRTGSNDHLKGPLDRLIDPPFSKDDPWYWLRDDERKDPEVLKYLKEENAYTQAQMKPTLPLQEKLYQEMKSRLQETRRSYPYSWGEGGDHSPYLYFSETLEGKSYRRYLRVPRTSIQVELLLDVNELAEGKSQCVVEEVVASPNHRYLAYGVDFTGDEEYEIRIQDLTSTDSKFQTLPFSIPYADFEWHPNSETLFYTQGDDQKRIYQAWSYHLPTGEATLLFEERDPNFELSISVSQDDQYLWIETESFDTSECWFARITATGAEKLACFRAREEGIRYELEHHRGRFLIRTNEKAVNFKLMSCSVGDHHPARWREEYVNPKEYLMDLHVMHDFLVLYLSSEGRAYFQIGTYQKEKGDYRWQIMMIGGDCSSVGWGENHVYDSPYLYLWHESMTQPPILYRVHLPSQEIKSVDQKEVPNYDPSQYQSRRIMVPGHDGTMIPVSLVSRKDRERKEPQPVYLYGYGAYGVTVSPDFDAQRVSLLDRGVVFAIAHVRGSSFLGYSWYLQGKKFQKMNSFHDFISVAEFLIQSGLTTSQMLNIEGRSAGGLLVGAVMTQRPDLFHSVVAGVPFVDALTTMADPTIPLTTPEWEQWGNSNLPEDFEYISKYSPYDQLKPTMYPHCLFLAGLHDPRVGYWEPTKFIAKLRTCDQGEATHLLKVELDEGHFGGSDRYRYLREKAFQYAFVLGVNGMLE